jgi:putative CocE/NonD family hydrolase
MPEIFEFLDEYVSRRRKDHRSLAVKVFVTGAEEWRELPSWPPVTEHKTFFLQGDKRIVSHPQSEESSPAVFIFDPTNPTPTMGGGRLSDGGRVDDSAYCSRSDVLVYTSESLTEEVELMGKPVVQLLHSTDIPYADLWVRLSEVDTQGISHNIVETFEVLDVKREDDMVSLELQDCAHVFKTNTRIRLIIAGGSFPLMARNLGVEGNRTLQAEMKSVTHTVRHENGASKLILPCPSLAKST